ncbi:ABC transporter [Gimesia sp.]|uniref:ABC transporter n=1 Tax=Gimesia sp. TaxID=2024833 RepID=UPI003A940669
MKFQLVLQFKGAVIPDYDSLVDLESVLIDEIQVDGKTIIDGHDFGSSEMNLFMTVDDPDQVLSQIRTKIQHPLMSRFKAGYRDVSEDRFHAMWPETLHEFSVKQVTSL